MITVMRRIEWDAGHRVLGHEGKCKHLHGHRYVAEVYVSAVGLDGLGRVVDFGVIKELVGKWVEANWDHNMMLNPNDPLLTRGGHPYGSEFVEYLVGRAPYILPPGTNPTAENIAKVLFEVGVLLLSSNPYIHLVAVTVWETPSCKATFAPQGWSPETQTHMD